MDHSRVTLSPIRSRDIPAIMQLHATLLPVSYPRSFFLHLLLQPSRLCLVARNNDDPIAFVSAVLHREQRLEILTLGVLPKFQQLHLATRLVYAVIDALTQATTAVTVFAQVSASNASARAFYEHIGMTIKGDVVHNLYTTVAWGSRDAYVVSGRLEARNKVE
ncbi:acyl-CoA N-acyltransferase [Favolaschia claudopus]|uniref:Acyl-CoA N-acyltransferase n=1 Tax=Favolaschia claudopus TaxID=2862362 RepID=A0AAW0CUQ3_9AGAR